MSMSDLPKISVPIICSNNEDTIGLVLESIKDIAFEIIVIIDTKSNDKTLEIVKKYTDKVSVEPWRGFLNQKNEALKRCTGDWVLSLDSDEVVSLALKKEILVAIKSPEMNGYFLNRRTVYLGREMKFAWQPDYRLRLCKRVKEVAWVGEAFHETLFAPGKTAKLKGVVHHYSYKDLNDHFNRTLQYAKGVAEIRFKNNKKFSYLKLVIAPPFAFLKQYFIKGGLFDGFPGFIAAISSGFYSLMKLIYLWELEKIKSKTKNNILEK